MSSLLKFFKKKIRPFKKCVCNPSVSFEETTSSPSSPKPSGVGGCRETNENFNKKPVENGLNQVISVSTILFNTPNSSPSSCTVVVDYDHNALSSMDEECTTTGADTYINTTNSNIDYNRAALCSGNPCFIFDSISNAPSRNLTPSSTASSNQSMVTYKTKYGVVNTPHVNEDDGLVCISLHQSILSQQSTPYNANEAVTACKLKKSSTFNYMQGEDDSGEHFKRSNTTYTLNQSKQEHSNQIRDYFNNLEMRRPVKRKANVRKLNEREAKQVKVAEEIYDNMEKLQDAFFNDSTLSNDETKKSSKNGSVNGLLLTPCSSNSNSHVTTPIGPADKANSLNESHKSFASLSDTSNVTNGSMEKLRRTSSLPKQLNQNNVSDCMNTSRVSLIRGDEANCTTSMLHTKETTASGEKLESQTLNTISSSSSNITETLVVHDEADDEEESVEAIDKDTTVNMVNSDFSECTEFKRGEPNTRLSKNIKQMFRNIVRQQMEALTNLERFYESQAAKLEADRQSNLMFNPGNKDRINAYYQAQLKSLEERVHANLQLLIENKQEAINSNNSESSFYTNLLVKKQQQSSSASTASGSGYLDELIRVNQEKASQLLLNHKLSQLMLLKQIHIQKHTTATNRSRPLVGLKSNLITQNNHLLPSYSKHQRKSLTNEQRATGFIMDCDDGEDQQKTLNDSQSSERVFKRNLSLPFKQRQARFANGVVESTIIKQQSRSPSSNASSSRIKLAQNKQAATSSPVYTKAIQKNAQMMSRKCFNSNEHLAEKEAEASSNMMLIENVNVECVTSAYAHIKRQNKSLSSMGGCQANEKYLPIRKNEQIEPATFCSSSVSMHSLNNGGGGGCNNGYGGGESCSRMLKYVSPRLSDGHLQYRIKMAGKSGNEYDVKSLVETQV